MGLKDVRIIPWFGWGRDDHTIDLFKFFFFGCLLTLLSIDFVNLTIKVIIIIDFYLVIIIIEFYSAKNGDFVFLKNENYFNLN